MSDQFDRDQALALDPLMREMPREVRNILHPVKMGGENEFCFRCHPDIACFNACCANIEIILTPYDILRLRRKLNLTSEEFLYEYATPYTLTKGQLPVPLIRMDATTGKCPFNTPAGCSVYADRPVTCRYYPIGQALMHQEKSIGTEEFFYLIREPYCLGHQEPQTWTVTDWRMDQGTDGYDQRNQRWMELILKRRSAGDAVSTSLQMSEFFYMASTNPEAFRRFVFESTFLQRFKVDQETLNLIRENDESLLDFAFDWLTTVLFGDKKIPLQPDAVAKLTPRPLSSQKEYKDHD